MTLGARAPQNQWADRNLVGTIARSIWQWQLILAFSTVVMGVAVAVLDVALFSSWPFVTGLMMIIAIGAVSMVIDWSRVPKQGVLALPLIDTLAIGLLTNAAQPFAFLWCFPIAWVSTYFAMTALLSTLALALATQLARWWDEGRTAGGTLTILIVLVSLGFLGVTISIGSRRTRAFRHLMRRQSLQLDRAMHRATIQEVRTTELLDAIRVALARVDTQGQLLATNAAYRALYSLGDDSLAHPSPTVEYAGYRGEALEPEQTSTARAARGELVDRERLWVYDAAGDWRALSLSIRDPDPSGTRGTIIELSDDTDAVRYQDEVRSTARSVSHELRNPLTAILGHADLLLEDDARTPTVDAHAAVIQNAAERMLVLIGTVLDTGSRPTRESDTFDLGHVAISSLAAFAPAAASAELTLQTRVKENLGVAGDGFRMRQVVDNLLSNAIKYTPRGGTVTVSAAPRGDLVELIVADTGIGIAQDDLSRIFDPYFRAQSATDGGVAGTGLGMGISMEIVRRNDGDLTLTSALGQGTTATVTLPALSPEFPEGDET